MLKPVIVSPIKRVTGFVNFLLSRAETRRVTRAAQFAITPNMVMDPISPVRNTFSTLDITLGKSRVKYCIKVKNNFINNSFVINIVRMVETGLAVHFV